MVVSKTILRKIDWFKSRGYLLGQRKDKIYIVHPQDGEKEFSDILDAEVYVEHMIAFRRDMQHPEDFE